MVSDSEGFLDGNEAGQEALEHATHQMDGYMTIAQGVLSSENPAEALLEATNRNAIAVAKGLSEEAFNDLKDALVAGAAEADSKAMEQALGSAMDSARDYVADLDITDTAHGVAEKASAAGWDAARDALASGMSKHQAGIVGSRCGSRHDS